MLLRKLITIIITARPVIYDAKGGTMPFNYYDRVYIKHEAIVVLHRRGKFERSTERF